MPSHRAPTADISCSPSSGRRSACPPAGRHPEKVRMWGVEPRSIRSPTHRGVRIRQCFPSSDRPPAFEGFEPSAPPKGRSPTKEVAVRLRTGKHGNIQKRRRPRAFSTHWAALATRWWRVTPAGVGTVRGWIAVSLRLALSPSFPSPFLVVPVLITLRTGSARGNGFKALLHKVVGRRYRAGRHHRTVGARPGPDVFADAFRLGAIRLQARLNTRHRHRQHQHQHRHRSSPETRPTPAPGYSPGPGSGIGAPASMQTVRNGGNPLKPTEA